MKDSLVNVKNPQGTAILIVNTRFFAWGILKNITFFTTLKTLILLFLLCKKEH